ncbi:MAG TPA: hypothetical protein VJU77_03150 [Chthoniobacterales bacterium]|nr:hypothetical protein [Chthoniobacterales bacterium]
MALLTKPDLKFHHSWTAVFTNFLPSAICWAALAGITITAAPLSPEVKRLEEATVRAKDPHLRVLITLMKVGLVHGSSKKVGKSTVAEEIARNEKFLENLDEIDVLACAQEFQKAWKTVLDTQLAKIRFLRRLPSDEFEEVLLMLQKLEQGISPDVTLKGMQGEFYEVDRNARNAGRDLVFVAHNLWQTDKWKLSEADLKLYKEVNTLVKPSS